VNGCKVVVALDSVDEVVVTTGFLDDRCSSQRVTTHRLVTVLQRDGHWHYTQPISSLIQNELLEQVDTFPYLGSLITEDGVPYQVKQRAGDRGITAENMKKSPHTDFNENTKR